MYLRIEEYRAFSKTTMHTCMLSHVQLFATPWTVAHQDPLPMGFPRQEYWSGLPFPPPGIFPTWEDRTQISCIFCIERWILYHWATWEAQTTTDILSISARKITGIPIYLASEMPVKLPLQEFPKAHHKVSQEDGNSQAVQFSVPPGLLFMPSVFQILHFSKNKVIISEAV